MITLSATLIAEQKKTNAVPYVELKAKENIASAGRLRWTRYYTGAEAITRHAAAMPSDGSLLRARIVANGANWDLSYSRVASPASGSTYSSWSTLVNTISSSAGLALGVFAGRVTLAYVDAAGTGINVKTSTDNGATFGAATLVDTALAAVTHLAIVYRDANTIELFYAADGIVYHVPWTLAGGWGARGAWTNTAATITGLAAHYYQDYNLLVTGTNAAGDSKLWQCVYGDDYSVAAGVWGGLKEIMSANSGSNVAHQHPSLACSTVFRATYLEAYTGTGAYTTPMASHTLPAVDYNDNLWREPWPLNITCATGVVIVTGTNAWMTTPDSVWFATIAPADVDLTANLQSLKAYVDEDNGKLTAVVDNASGAYLEANGGKGDAWIGCELRLGLGYHTTAGNEAATHLSFWVDSYELTAEPAKAQLVLHAVSPAELLRRWTAARQISWAAGSTSITNILKYVLARAGMKMTLDSASGQLATVLPGFTIMPAFTIRPKETLLSAVQRLMAYVTDGVRFQNATAVFTDRQAADTSDYTLGTTHVIKSAKYRSGQPSSPLPSTLDSRLSIPNRVQVFVNGAFGHAHDWANIELTATINDQAVVWNLTTAAQAADQATVLLRQATIATKDDTVLLPPSCGLEIHDVVDVTEARAGLSTAKRRVKAMAVTYDTKTRKFEQLLTLGGV